MLPETNLAVVQLFLLPNFSPDLTLSYNIMLKKGTARDDNIKTFEFWSMFDHFSTLYLKDLTQPAITSSMLTINTLECLDFKYLQS